MNNIYKSFSYKVFGRHLYLRAGVNKDFVKIRKDVFDAVASLKPVVALESTIITHGMPYPHNINTALTVEKIIEEQGAFPATVGIINGELIVGLTKREVKYLAENKDECIKTSRRDLGYVLSKKYNGGTTVSATMVAAKHAGIDLFVTGGIGGVHRGAEKTFDISADLHELGQTPVAVICAGIKSILDIGLTLEYLETRGVPVISYSKTRNFPSFFSSRSKYKAPYNIDTAFDVAKCFFDHKSLDLTCGMLVGVPIPSEYSADDEQIEMVIQEALAEARAKNIMGKDITPFVLQRVSEISDGASLQANIKLIENNAKVGAAIAIEYSKLKRQAKDEIKNNNQLNDELRTGPMTTYKVNADLEIIQETNTEIVDDRLATKTTASIRSVTHAGYKRAVIIGGSALDITATANTVHHVAESTNSGKVHLSSGGVARNIAEFLTRCEAHPLLISSIGDDQQGNLLMHNMRQLNMDLSGINISRQHSTDTFCIVASQETGELLMVVGDMRLGDTLSPQMIASKEKEIQDAALVVLDANSSSETIQYTIGLCNRYNVPVWFEPTCLQKATRPFLNQQHHQQQIIDFTSPNIIELDAIQRTINRTDESMRNETPLEDFDLPALLNMAVDNVAQCDHTFRNVVVTLGKHGVLLCTSHCESFRDAPSLKRKFLHFPAVADHLLPVEVKSVSGAGDSLAGGIVYGILQDYDLETCVKGGLFGAYKSLHSYSTISNDISSTLLSKQSINQWAGSLQPTLL